MSRHKPVQTTLSVDEPLETLYAVTSALFAIAELTDPLWKSESPAQRFGALALVLANQLDGIYDPLSHAVKQHKAHTAQESAHDA